MRRWLLGLALGLGLWPLGPAAGLTGPATVSAIFAGAHEGRLELEIWSSQPLNYILIEGADPFTVSLLFLDATFGFPPAERELPGPGLTKIRTSVLERKGSQLGRLDLNFAKVAPYEIIKEDTRILLRVDAPALAAPLVLAGSRGPRAEVPSARPTSPERTPDGTLQIVKVVPRIVGADIGVLVGATGPLVYRSFTMRKPYRVVVDFEQARLVLPEGTLEHSIEVGNAVLRRIRSSQFSSTAVRVVLDLARPKSFWVEEQAQGVIIHVGTARP